MTVQIPHDHKIVSFDVTSLFTSIPLQLALDCTETAINNSTFKLLLPTNDIMNLLKLCLTLTYFQYNGKDYSYTGQLLAHRSPLLLLKLSSIEEQALATYKRTDFGYTTSTKPLLLYTKTRLTSSQTPQQTKRWHSIY